MLYLPEKERQLFDRTLSLDLSIWQIVCGDCAGQDNRPAKTVLTLAGCCSKCGGRSYELASVMFSVAGIRIRRVMDLSREKEVANAADSTVYGTSKNESRISV